VRNNYVTDLSYLLLLSSFILGRCRTSRYTESGITNLERFCSWRSYPDRDTIPSCVWRENPRKPFNVDCDASDKIRTGNLPLEYKPNASSLDVPRSSLSICHGTYPFKVFCPQFPDGTIRSGDHGPLRTSLYPETGVLTANVSKHGWPYWIFNNANTAFYCCVEEEAAAAAISIALHYQENCPKKLNTRNCEQADRCNYWPSATCNSCWFDVVIVFQLPSQQITTLLPTKSIIFASRCSNQQCYFFCPLPLSSSRATYRQKSVF